MATLLGSLLVSLGLESGEFKSGLSAAEKQLRASAKRIEAVGKSMQGLGAKLTVGVTAPMAAFAKASVDGFIEQQKAMADVNAALKSMGDASGRTAAQLGKAADAMEMRSLFDAEVILKQVTANLLTFGNVAGEQFDRAQQAALDMATRMGGEPQAAAIMLGKALNDPVKGITALTRVGVQFTEAQKAQIKAMSAAGDAAGAQGVILAEVERQFKGAAAAAADASPWRAAQVAIGQAMDVIGEAVLPIIAPLADAIARLASAFASLPGPMQEAIVIAAALAAALGPVIFAFGSIVSAGSTLFAAMGAIGASMAATGTVAGAATVASSAFGAALAALAPLAVPLAAIAAVGALIYANWEKIAPVLTELWQGPFGDLMRAAGDRIAQVGREFMAAIGPDLIAIIKGLGTVVVSAFRFIVDALNLVAAVLSADWGQAWVYAQKVVVDAVRIIGDIINALVPGATQAMANLVSGVRRWIVDGLNAIWNSALAKIETVKRAFFDLYDAVVGHSYIPDMVDGIAANMARLDAEMVSPAKTAAERTKQVFEKLGSDVDGIMRRLFPDSVTEAGFMKDRAALTSAIAGGGVKNYTVPQLQEALKRLQSEEFKEAFKDFQVSANDNAEKVEAANVRVVRSFKDMADETISSLQNLANSIKGGGFLDILGSVLNLGLQLGSIGAFGKKVQTNINAVPKHANGTMFAHGGLSLVGERGPELVNLPRGSQVVANRDLRVGARSGVTNNYFGPGADVFWGQVDRRAQGVAMPLAAQAASSGSTGAQVAMAVKQSRRFP